MKTSTAVALGLLTLLVAGGGTAAAVYFSRSKSSSGTLPNNAAAPGVVIVREGAPTQTAAPGANIAKNATGALTPPSQSEAQKLAGDVKAWADTAKTVAGAVTSIAEDLKGIFGDD